MNIYFCQNKNFHKIFQNFNEYSNIDCSISVVPLCIWMELHFVFHILTCTPNNRYIISSEIWNVWYVPYLWSFFVIIIELVFLYTLIFNCVIEKSLSSTIIHQHIYTFLTTSLQSPRSNWTKFTQEIYYLLLSIQSQFRKIDYKNALQRFGSSKVQGT